ncbi:hypothetical protein J0X14_17215 [Muricauda sp. CAU 1633]|uniref:hypothetical protein n=1 Tax=Allomuricauda sp. CAU 1633 TaxID=2816036 RepID=UPI001A8D5AEB|nr:hypothetical protein [Muricauda sp. CAU 1633]MBO0324052.1 hypothetical protein [Muricauda sp. CAU 1633]
MHIKKLLVLFVILISFEVDAQINKEILKQKVSEESKSSNFDSITKSLGYKGGDKVLVLTIFTINKEGEIVNVKARGPHPLFEKEAIRILQNTPEIVPENFKPREEDPKFSLPITFVIETERQKAKRIKKENRNRKSKN